MKTARNVFVELRDGDDAGWGEHAPSERVTGEGFEDVRKEVAELQKNPDWVERLLEDPEHLPPNTPRRGTRNAFVSAWLDFEGRRKDAPAHKLLNLPAGRIASTITIPLGTPEASVKAARAYLDEGWACFKVKLGGDHDEATIKALRDAFPETPIRVDANEGWSLDEATKMLPLLHRLEVEFVEQPLARDAWDGLKELRNQHEVPVFLDESVLDTDDLLKAIRQDAGDGVVIKLAKCGGLVEARRMVKMARDHGWKIMVGCMIESSCGIAAGAALAGVVDYLDLDGNALIANDPFGDGLLDDGRITTPDRPGLGVDRRPDGAALEPLTASRAA